MNTPLKSTALAAAAAALLGAAGVAHAAEYANVVSATPVTGSVPVPRQQCAEGERYVQQQPSGGGALIGAIIGGVVGNQFGHGAGRAAATGLGVVAGSAIGNQAEINNNPGQAVPVRNCRTVSAYENRVVGYDVVYEYHGQRYTTRTQSDPGPRLAIDVRPAAAPLDRVGPPVGTAVPPAYTDRAYADPDYVDSPPAYYAPAPAYYAPAPVYYAPSPYYYPPAVIGIGFYGGGGWHHGYRHWH
ncbi:MAG: glycine zipper 2TM domain-containing protein [Caldimonas sp.]